jgi:hypothetical protein
MSLTTFDLPVIFACGVELAQATANYRPEDYQGPAEMPEDFTDGSLSESEAISSLGATMKWHDAMDAIVQASNRLKRALGATGPLDAGDQLHNKAEPTWENFQNQFKYVAHPPKVRQALRKLASAAMDLSGYATIRVPDEMMRERGMRLLGQGLAQLWSGIGPNEREAVTPFLPQTTAALGWPPSSDCDPPPYDGPEELTECFRVVDITGGFVTRSRDFPEQQAAALVKAFPREPAPSFAVSPQSPLSPIEVAAPTWPFQFTNIFDPAVKYAVVIWDKKSEVTSDRDPFDCIPDFPEIGVARFHLSVALGIPNRTIEGWKEEVRKAELSDLARQALVHLNKAVEWERLPRDDVGNRQPGSLATSFGLLQKGLQELYLAMSPPDQANVKHLVPLIRERWDKGFPSRKGKKERIPKEEANIRVREHLRKNPKATTHEIREATGVSVGAISQSTAWKAHRAKGANRKDQHGRQAKAVPLTRKMLETLGQSADPSNSIAAEEAAWQALLEKATPEERARLRKMNDKERAKCIQILLEQTADQIEDEKGYS